MAPPPLPCPDRIFEGKPLLENKTIAVVVPCFNEQTQIERVLTTLPGFVDLTIVVDDASTDCTVGLVRKFIAAQGQAGKTILLELKVNSGVGAAIVAGYREAAKRGIDVTAVMAGDAQMDPDELPLLAGLVARGECDYAKGNRLFYRGAWETIPRHRYLGNAFLSMLTKIASGYWHVADSQTGYTAISLKALQTIELDGIYPRYGYPNDMLVRLNVYNFRVRDVPIRPVYDVGEQSKMKVWKVVPTMSWLIFKRFLWRIKEKYIIHDFHPLVFFYAFGGLSFTIGLLLGLYLLAYRIVHGPHVIAETSALMSVFLFMMGLQLLLFGMWFDMESNKDLK
jgi:glycosyltransferase involved in cell wall biosynthesis